MATSQNVIPAKRFTFTDNQEVMPLADFYSQDLADVINGQIPGAATAASSIGNLSGVLNTQMPGSNLVSSALNGVSSIGAAIGDVTGAIGEVISDVGQLVGGVINTICGIASDVLDDAFSLVNSAIGGVMGAVDSIFGSITSLIPGLGSLTSSCASGLFKGSLGITGPKGALCGLNNACGGGVLTSLVQSLTCTSGSIAGTNPASALTNSLQSNFLGNVGSQALSSLGINNVMSALSRCPSNPFNIQTMNGFALNTLQNGSSTAQMLDFGNVGGVLGTGLSTLGSMVPNSLSNFTNNFTMPTNSISNIIGGGYSAVNIDGAAVQNAFNAVQPGWDTSSTDGIPSIANIVGVGSSQSPNLTNTTTYGLYQQAAAVPAGSYSAYGNSSNWAGLNSSAAQNPYAQTYMSMGSGSNNGVSSVSNTVNNLLGGGSLAAPLSPVSNGMNGLFGSGSSSAAPSSNVSNTMNNLLGSGSSQASTKTTFGVTSVQGGGSSNALQVQVVKNTIPATQANVSSVFGGGSSTPESRPGSMSSAISAGVNASATYYNVSSSSSSSISSTTTTTTAGTGSTAQITQVNSNSASGSNSSSSSLSTDLFGASSTRRYQNSNSSGLVYTLDQESKSSTYVPPTSVTPPSVMQGSGSVVIPNSIF